jgi:subtilisin
MKRFTIALALAAAIAGTFGARQLLGQGASRSYIVVFHDDERNTPGLASEHARAYGASLSHVYGSALKGYAATIPDGRIDDIRRDPRVAFVSEDRPVQAVQTDTETLPKGIDRIDAEPTVPPRSFSWTNVAVAVIDTGSGPHSDLNIVGGTNCSTGSKSNFSDVNGHGTHVAGTIGAIDNTWGVVGVAPGVPIYSVRVLNNQGSGSWSSVACGIDWVTAKATSDQSVKFVANLSLGGSGTDNKCGVGNPDALHTAICNSVAAGVTYVVAAGNDNSDLAGFVPAAYDEVLAVTAVADFNGAYGGGVAATSTCPSDVDDTSANFSNYTTLGSPDAGHTIAAPGVCIKSTWKGGGYNTISGTSMASPHVAGTAALCIAKGTGRCAVAPNVVITPSDVITQLRADAAAHSAAYPYGFTVDPSAILNRYFGFLVYAGGY